MSAPQLPCVDNFSVDRPSISLPSTAATDVAGNTSFAAPAAMEVPEVVKRKRGRPARPGSAAKPGAPPPAKKCKEEEDVCFICFDGGNLVLCDRRDCPKAYHPACIKRDESFFTPQLRWNCGWHLCNSCQRNAIFMCYTCPYSLCKTCVKQADILCVRGNKGFCRACVNTIMLIENVTQENKEVVTIDFDDTSSWEYLFKVYWVCLKQKESLTLDDLSRATNPWKSVVLNHIANPSTEHHITFTNRTVEMGSTAVQSDVNNSSCKRKTRKQPPLQNNSRVVVVSDKLKERAVDWATKELLEFIAHMNNGDTSVLSQFDVQALLLEYIRKNNLRDPHRKCQVICDKRLEILFGKAQVGHFEMLKLIEYHFKDDSCASGVVNAAAPDSSAARVEIEQCTKAAHISTRDRKRQARKKLDCGGRQTNLNDYAAINSHNMNLIYLRRSLMEKLLEDQKFNDKVVGSIVRIRISDSDLKQEMYRLVRVVGASKASEPYKVGERTTQVMLKILNLGRIEDVMADAISNQDFSEDECKRLRQIIKCGLVEKMTVGEVQDIAIALQEVKLKDVLEAEISKLNSLRDRASEMGLRKQLRECVEKLELLKSPEERQRRIHDIPEVHADPRMDPSCQPDEHSEQSDTTKQDLNMNRKHSSSNSSTELISPRRGDMPYNTKTKVLRNDRSNEGSQSTLELEADAARILEELRNRADLSPTTFNHEAMTSANQTRIADESSVTSSSSESPLTSDNTELEEMWHYRDPSGKVQGPFCMLLLRKWNSSGYFPTDLRVWRTNENQDESVLLTDALLSKQCHNEHDVSANTCLESPETRLVSESRKSECDSDLTDASTSTEDTKQTISLQNNGQEAVLDRCTELPCNENQNCPGVLSSAASSDTHATLDPNNKPECSDLPSSVPKVDIKDSECLATEAVQCPSTTNPTSQISGSNLDLNCTAPKCPDLPKSEPCHGGLDVETSGNKVATITEVEANENKCLLSQFDAGTHQIEISDVSSLTQAPKNEDSKSQVTEIKPEQDPGSSLNNVSSGIDFSTPVVFANIDDKGVEGPTTEHCITSNNTYEDPVHGKPCVQDLDSGIAIKVEDADCEHATTTQASCQVTNSSSIVPDWNTCSWFDGPIELCTLGDESVSDLLSEVEAFECLHGMPSPNALMNFENDLIGSPINNCFSPFMGYAWSPSSDIQFQSQLMTGEYAAQFADLHDCLTNPPDPHSSLPGSASGQ